VIGHSHGGSVALLAMRDFQDKEVKLLLITLATPFMEVESRFISGKFASAVNGLENSAALLFCLLALTFQATFEASPETQFLALFAVVLIILALKTFIGKIGQTDAADQERLDDLHTMTEGGLTLKAARENTGYSRGR
jgi:pimeloyl-ACP methyl ester carboxylesterase